MEKADNTNKDILRNKAEELSKKRTTKPNSSLTESDALKLIHALEVHQIELELQNEELSLAKNELESATKKYTELYDFAPNGYFTFTQEGNISELNLAGAKMLGKDRSQLINTQFVFFVAHNSKLNFNLFLKQVFESSTSKNAEIILSTPKNSDQYIYLTGIANESKDLCYVTAVDMTEKRQAEEELKEHQELFSMFMHHSPIYTFIKEVSPNESQVLQASDNFKDMIGIAGTDMIGKTMKELFPPEFADKISADDWDVVKQGKVLQLEEELNDRIFNTIKFPIKMGNKNLLAGYTIDITEQKKAEKVLTNYKKIVSSTPNPTALIDKNYRYVIVNKAYESFSNMKSEELAGQMMTVYTGVETFKHKIKENFDKCLAGEMVNFQLWHTFVTKGERYIDVNYFPYKNENNEIEGIVSITKDITEIKMAEQALRESEERMRLAIANSPVPIMIHDEDDNILQLSKGWTKFSGYTINDIPTLGDWTEKAYGKSSGVEKEYIDKLFETNESTYNGEWNVKAKDGTMRIWDFQSTPIGKLHNGRRVLHSMALDITERKNAEKELLRGKELLSQTGRMAKVGGWELEVSTMKIYFTDETFNIYELPVGNVPSIEEGIKFYAPEAQEKIRNAVTNAIEKNIPYDIELPFITAKGKNIWVRTHCQTELKDGKVVRLFGTIQDITKRYEADLALISEQNRLRTLIDNLPDAIYVQDKKGRKMIANPADVENIGASKEADVLGKNDMELFPGEVGLRCYNESMDVLQAGKPLLNKEEYFLKNGSKNWMLTSKIPLFDSQNKIIGLVGIGHDITDQKNTEKELIEAKEKAEESDRLKSAFLANMSHEIRTPMNGILGFSELLKEPQLSGEEQQKYIAIIEKSGARMLNTINNIIDISKIEAGQMQISISKFDIREQVESIISFFKPEAEKKGIQLFVKNNLVENECFLYSDKEKIYAILTNLVKNALKFCINGHIEIGVGKKENEYEFYVKDNGKGIPADRQQAIFERFIQADIQDRDAAQGSGLGLAISKSYIEMLGGKIWLTSKEGQGTTFYYTIPIGPAVKEKEIQEHPAKVKESPNQTKKLKVLIAEDEQVSGMLMEKLIEKFSSETLSAKTGNEAISVCKKHPDIDLILMDIRMPELDGYQATKKIREFNTNVIIIAQTAFALSGDREKAIKAGCNDHVTKPIDQKKLNKIIKNYFH